MATLTIPMHMPIRQTEHLLTAELRWRDVTSVKIKPEGLVIEHERRDLADNGDCVPASIIV